MLIFNTTYHISPELYDEWYKWIIKEHIPFMLKTRVFTNPQLAKVLQTDETEGSSYSLQFLAASLEDVTDWHAAHGEIFDTHCSRKFGTEVLFFSTLLEKIAV